MKIRMCVRVRMTVCVYVCVRLWLSAYECVRVWVREQDGRHDFWQHEKFVQCSPHEALPHGPSPRYRSSGVEWGVRIGRERSGKRKGEGMSEETHLSQSVFDQTSHLWCVVKM